MLTTTTYEVRQQPTARGLLVAALVCVVGLAATAIAEALGRPLWLLLPGLLLLAAGVALSALLWLQAARAGVQVNLDPAGYRIEGRQAAAGAWAEVGRVTRGRQAITLHRKDGTALRLTAGRGGQAVLDALGADLAARLDADRGYRHL